MKHFTFALFLLLPCLARAQDLPVVYVDASPQLDAAVAHNDLSFSAVEQKLVNKPAAVHDNMDPPAPTPWNAKNLQYVAALLLGWGALQLRKNAVPWHWLHTNAGAALLSAIAAALGCVIPALQGGLFSQQTLFSAAMAAVAALLGTARSASTADLSGPKSASGGSSGGTPALDPVQKGMVDATTMIILAALVAGAAAIFAPGCATVGPVVTNEAPCIIADLSPLAQALIPEIEKVIHGKPTEFVAAMKKFLNQVDATTLDCLIQHAVTGPSEAYSATPLPNGMMEEIVKFRSELKPQIEREKLAKASQAESCK